MDVKNTIVVRVLVRYRRLSNFVLIFYSYSTCTFRISCTGQQKKRVDYAASHHQLNDLHLRIIIIKFT